MTNQPERPDVVVDQKYQRGRSSSPQHLVYGTALQYDELEITRSR
jgi:hypothetical protein